MEKTTANHEEIRRWAEERGGTPAVIDHPVARADRRGIRIDFPGEDHEALRSEKRPASWDEFFRIFEEEHLLFSYDTEAREGDPTAWYHFEKRSGP